MPRFKMYPLRANNVLELYQQRELINLDPPYQRLSVWDERKQQLFIDSIINQVDIPKLYFHDLLPSQRGGRYKYAVIDGKQRLIALWRFVTDRLPLASDFVFFEDERVKAAGATYRELLEKFPVLRARFDGFQGTVILVQAEDEFFIEELFTRLNVAVPLSAPEYRNAMGGPLPLLIKKVALTAFFKDCLTIRDNRYQHLDLAAKFLYLVRHPGFNATKKVTLDDFVRQYKAAREQGRPIASASALSELESNTQQHVEAMCGFFRDKDPLLRSVGRVTLYFHMFRVHQQLGVSVPFTREHLERFNAEVTAARLKSQRMARGSGEVLTEEEQILINFDREKQSPNDGGALERQYGYLREYFQRRFRIDLADPH